MSKQIHGKNRHDGDVHSITDARAPHTDEMRTRMIKYSVSMGIRVVCLILVFVVDGWLQWAFVAGAVFLPYFAVIIANGGSDTSKFKHSDSLLDQAPAPELEAGTRPEPGTGADRTTAERPDDDGDSDDDVVLPGELVDDTDENTDQSGSNEPYGDNARKDEPA